MLDQSWNETSQCQQSLSGTELGLLFLFREDVRMHDTFWYPIYIYFLNLFLFTFLYKDTYRHIFSTYIHTLLHQYIYMLLFISCMYTPCIYTHKKNHTYIYTPKTTTKTNNNKYDRQNRRVKGKIRDGERKGETRRRRKHTYIVIEKKSTWLRFNFVRERGISA